MNKFNKKRALPHGVQTTGQNTRDVGARLGRPVRRARTPGDEGRKGGTLVPGPDIRIAKIKCKK